MNVGQASTASGVSQRMIRYYEKVLLIPAPTRQDSGYRDYSDEDVARLRLVADARAIGFEAEEIRELLSSWAPRGHTRPSSGSASAALLRRRLDEKALSLERVRDALLDE